MRIIELKSQNVKMIYKPLLCQLRVGDFVSFKEGELTLIAQVYKLSSYAQSTEYNQAELTFVLTSKYDKISKWKGELVSLEAQIEITPLKFIESYVNQDSFENTFSLGYYGGSVENAFKFNCNNFTAPSIIAYEKYGENANFVKNLAAQFVHIGKKFLILDYKGNIDIDGAVRVMAGFQDKLALNAEILENLSDKITEGISLENKAIIDDILADLTKYTNEVPEKFISIMHLINVIDEIHKQYKIPQLLLLKNKLLKYKKANIFADDLNDITALDNALNQRLPVIYDLSNVPFEWQNEFCSKSLNLLKEKRDEYYFNTIVDEKTFNSNTLKYLLFKANKDGIKPVLSFDYRNGLLNNILEFCQNVFFLKTHNNLKKHQNINEMIQAMPQEYFITCGKLTSNIAIVTCLDNSHINIVEEYSKIFENIDNNETLDIIEEHIDLGTLTKEQQAVTNIDMNVLNNALEPEPRISYTPVGVKQTEVETADIILDENIQQDNNLETANNTEENIEFNAQEIIQADIDNSTVSESIFVHVNSTDEITVEAEPIPNIDREDENNIVFEEQLGLGETLTEEEIPVEINEIKDLQVESEQSVEIPDLQDNQIQLETFSDNQIQDETISENEIPADIMQPKSNILADEPVDASMEINTDINDLQELENIDNLNFEDEEVSNELKPEENSIEELTVDDLDFLDDTVDEQTIAEPQQAESVNVENDDDLLDLLGDVDEDIFDEQDDEDNSYSDFDEPKEVKPQKLPVYNANYDNNEDKTLQIDLKEGDLVKHNKYGVGTVTKITAHGDKVLCHINFDDFGRRLLDPVISQLQKIE